MRTNFINQLIEEARKNPELFLIVGDLGYHVIEPFAKEFPERFINAGIAEQNMAGTAAGLSMTGYNVYIYSIGNFPTARCLEQIRNDIAYHKANVKIVSIGAGYAYGTLGATHQTTEDIGIMRSIPNLVIATPGDPIEAKAIATLSANYDGPMYIRLGKANEKIVHKESVLSLHIGDILPIMEGKGDTAVLACGAILDSAWKEIEENGLNFDLYSVPFVKPLDSNMLISIIESHKKGLIIMEEHQKSCGVGSAIIEIINDLFDKQVIPSYPRVHRIAINDEFLNVVGSQTFLRECAGLSLVHSK